MIGYLAIFIGGGFGSLARYGLSKAFYNPLFPIGTLLVNFISCVIIGGGLIYFGEKLEANNTIKLLVITGFCGGFSTFSTFSFETFELFNSGATFLAILNIAISLVFCVSVIYGLSKLI